MFNRSCSILFKFSDLIISPTFDLRDTGVNIILLLKSFLYSIIVLIFVKISIGVFF